MLNYTSAFVCDYKRLVQPIVDLMGDDGVKKWEQKHTDALNTLGELIWRRFKLSLVDMKQPARLYVDADSTHCSAVLC